MQEEVTMGGWVRTNLDDIHILDTIDLIFYLINIMQVIKYVFSKEGPS